MSTSELSKRNTVQLNELQSRQGVHLALNEWMKRHSLISYYILALALSWMVEIPLVAVKQGWTNLPIPFAIHYLAAFGPMLAALIVTGLTGGRVGLKKLCGDMIRWRVGWKWVLFAISSPVVIFLVAMPIVRLVKGEWPDLSLLGQANYLPYLGIWVLPVWLVTFGFGEETGWRGFALPRLQKTMSASRATLILGLMWSFWHLPALFYLDTYTGMSPLLIPGMIFSVLCGAVLLTWLYNGTRGSILMVAIWHALFDLVTASAAGQEIIPILTSAGVIAWALIIANVDRPWGFRFQVKHTV